MYSYAPTPIAESDEALKRRLLYVAGDGQWLTQLIANASGGELDEIASHYNLRRRQP